MLEIDNSQNMFSLQIEIEEVQEPQTENQIQEIKINLKNQNKQIQNFFHSQNQAYEWFINQDFSMFQCQGCRKEQQDRFCYAELKRINYTDKFFGIFDGHGSQIVSNYLAQTLPQTIFNHMLYEIDIKVAIEESFRDINNYIIENLQMNQLDSGSTAHVCIIQENQIIICNLGDSQSQIIFKKKNSKTQILNNLHNTKNNQELQRIKSQGGFLIKVNNTLRVQGQIEITRSFGDQKYQPFISCEPEINFFDKNEKQNFILMASDGFWNQVEIKYIKDDIQNLYNNPSMIKELIENNQGYLKDNLTLNIIKLN